MKSLAKKILPTLPVSLQRTILRAYEKIHIGQAYPDVPAAKNPSDPKNILFYHVSALSFGGTEKFLQIIAKHVNPKKYRGYFMYSPQPRNLGSVAGDGRKKYLENSPLELISFSYSNLSQKYPYRLANMKPSLIDTIKDKKIDLIVTPTSGYTEYPINEISSIPIILLNNFGAPNVQPNIVKNVCVSHEVAGKIRPIVPEEKIAVMYVLSEKPPESAAAAGIALRQKFGVKDTDTVFGRIGRADNNIFDEIGIRAFQKIVADDSSAHYFIMSPPPILVSLVANEKIPNVHFLPPSADENDIWAFHASLDALAHFRKDGESCGLNIAESMLSKKPIISHKSPQWNAHLEYLEPAFSRIAEIGNIDQYASHMKEFIALKKTGELKKMGLLAEQKAGPLFLVEANIPQIEAWIDAAIDSQIASAIDYSGK
jgi:glycosyltransferase involved in cell wall biosynthesis